ncbi:hypothetical protein HZA85_00525 [Candidatus Uhrbacteria bacterium]|nr:hypothetical protein [Candidatus Uhrbacteria bacterium]
MRFSTLFCAIALSFASVPARALCIKDATVTELMDAGRKAEQAFSLGDLKHLHNQATLAREEIIPCLKTPLAPKEVAAFHRLMALDALTRYNFKRVVSEYHAARRLDPGYIIPPEVAEGDHPLIGYYADSANVPDGMAEPVFAPEGGYVLVGGVRNAPRLSETPVVIQVYGPGNVWVETRYFLPGEKLPTWGKNLFGVSAKDLGIDTTPLWQKPTPWYVSAGVSAALAAVFYGLAMSEKSKFNNVGTADSELASHRDRANGFGVTSLTTAGIAVILTGVGVGVQIHFGGQDKPSIAPSAMGLMSLRGPFATGVDQ